MPTYWFEQAYIEDNWQSNARISISLTGDITQVSQGPCTGDDIPMRGPAMPGIPNIHSHAFQRAMAGLTEEMSAPNDTFWTWRNIMYQFASAISPEDQHAIAAQLYMEMLKSGYTSVGEFHYLHNQPSGQQYANPAELSLATINAANQAGIGLTHLPVLYMSSHFGGAPLKQQQKRFYNSVESFHSLLKNLSGDETRQHTDKLGIALHSLRAVPPEAITETLRHLQNLDEAAPIHIHIAEQTLEVDECISWNGKRPVEWLLENHQVNERWCLVHATHLSDSEVHSLAESGAIAGLCPTTEANLGDGFFPLAQYLRRGGNIAIGSDSNISVSPIEELRWLEYGQRLKHQGRNIAASAQTPLTAENLIQRCLAGGASALGRKIGKLAPGYSADILVLDRNSPHLYGKPTKNILSALTFCGNTPMISDVICKGRHVVSQYRHVDEERITEAYRKTVSRLQSNLS